MKSLGALAACWLIACGVATGQSRSAFPGTLDQHPVIDYRGGPLTDDVSTLQRDVARGAITLKYEGRTGFLISLLDRLNVPIDSQLLLFSKTGIQRDFTGPENPRALYFNDRVVVGYIPGAPLIELASHDPRQGVIFHTLAQAATPPNLFARSDRCTGCHLTGNTMFVPGILVRSNFTGADGRTMPALGNFIIDHRSPLEQRWGGWYVTGTHGAARHMGNAMVIDTTKPESAIGEGTLNRRTLIDRVDAASYLRPTSDITALMVFDHQGRAINLLTSLGWETRVAAAEDRLDFSKGELGELARETADYLAFADEAPLPGPIQGVSEFTNTFSVSGPRDRKGRSLRQLDLRTRLFKYRCSYMIYSPAFDALPQEARAAVFARLRETITDRDTTEILDDTKAGWRR
jgi:hypothetical protein